MKITIYTITTCQFSKQEKEYLSSHGLQFEEKNLETNREFLTEMLAVGGNFAGTPVTKIEKDDGQIAVLKGFTAADFDKTLGFVPAPEKKQDPTAAPDAQTAAPAAVPGAQPATAAPTPAAPMTPETPPVVQQPEIPQPPAQDPAMASVLNTLEQQAVAAPAIPAAPVAPATPAAPVAGAPVIPDPQF